MTREVALTEAKDQFSALVQEVQDSGEDVLITKHGQPVVRVSAVAGKHRSAAARRANMNEIARLRDKMVKKNPDAGKPIPWETLKGWMYGEGEDAE